MKILQQWRERRGVGESTKESDDSPPREGQPIRLRNKQVTFLRVLSQARGPLPRLTLCERAKAHPTQVAFNALGAVGLKERASRESKTGYPSLLTLGFVSIEQLVVEGKRETLWSITPAGRQYLHFLEGEQDEVVVK